MRKILMTGSLVLLLVLPLVLGYLGAPCDALLQRPLPPSPHRLAQQRFLEHSATALDEMAYLTTELSNLVQATEPQSMAESFRRAGRVSDLALQLEQIKLATAPETYTLLGERISQVRDTYILVTEYLLTYLGNDDYTSLQQARDTLALADFARVDLVQAVAGLRSPLCRNLWQGQ